MKKKGMTLAQLCDILNTHHEVHATATQTDELSLDHFRELLEKHVGGSGYVSENTHYELVDMCVPPDPGKLSHVSAGPAGRALRPYLPTGRLLQDPGHGAGDGCVVGDKTCLGQTL